jgi:hypothetical protein
MDSKQASEPTTASAVLVAYLIKQRQARRSHEAKNASDLTFSVAAILGGSHNSVANIPLRSFLKSLLIAEGGFLQRRIAATTYNSDLFQ